MSKVNDSRFFEENISDVVPDSSVVESVYEFLEYCSDNSTYMDVELVRTESELERFTLIVYSDCPEETYSPSKFNNISKHPFLVCLNSICGPGDSGFVLHDGDDLVYKTLISKRRSDGTSVTIYDGPFTIKPHKTMYYIRFVRGASSVGEGIRKFANSNEEFDLDYSIVRKDGDDEVITRTEVDV